MSDTDLPPPSETTPWVSSGTSPRVAAPLSGSTDLPAVGQTTPYVSKTAQTGDSGSVPQAIGTGVIKGVPFGKDIAAAGLPLVKNYLAPAMESIARPINRFLGVDQDALDKQWKQASDALPSSYSEAKASGEKAEQEAAEAHPWVQAGASMATGAAVLPTAGPIDAVSGRALPYLSSLGKFAPAASRAVGAGTVSGAYGGLYGAGEGDSLEDRLYNAGIGTGMGVGLGSIGQVAGEGLGALTQPRGPAIDAANRLGVPMPRYSVSNPAVQRVGELSKSVPVVGEWTRASSQHAADALNENLSAMGGGVTPEKAGTAASSALNDWFDRSQDLINRHYTYASTQLDQNMQHPISATNTLINSMAAKAAQRGSTLSGRAIDEINNANTVPGGLTYGAIKDLRTTIDQLKGSWGNINPDPIDAARITRLHGALSQDLDAAARAADRTGGQGFAAHQNASRIYKAVQSDREDLTPLIGAQGDKPAEQVFAGLARKAGDNPSSADVALLNKAKMAIQNSNNPGAWDTFQQAIINRLGRKPSGDPTTESTFSPDLYLNHYSGITDDAKKAVFSPENLAKLNDSATVAQKMKEAGFAKNTSGTSHMTGALGTMFGLYHAIPAIMAHPYIGAPAAAATALGARALSRPVTAQAPSAMDAYLKNLARQAPIQSPYLTGQQRP